MAKIKKGDNVKVLLGKDRGKTGTVERVLGKEGKVLISGVNVYKRHVSKRVASQAGSEKGSVIDIVKPIYLSNVALVCPNCKKATRVGFKLDGSTKIRVCKKCKKEIR